MRFVGLSIAILLAIVATAVYGFTHDWFDFSEEENKENIVQSDTQNNEMLAVEQEAQATLNRLQATLVDARDNFESVNGLVAREVIMEKIRAIQSVAEAKIEAVRQAEALAIQDIEDARIEAMQAINDAMAQSQAEATLEATEAIENAKQEVIRNIAADRDDAIAAILESSKPGAETDVAIQNVQDEGRPIDTTGLEQLGTQVQGGTDYTEGVGEVVTIGEEDSGPVHLDGSVPDEDYLD